MPEKSWEKWLSESCWMFSERITEKGKVVRFRVILLAELEGQIHCVTRYDTAHGFPHRDILAIGGRQIGKEITREGDLNLAFAAACRDIESNHERYLRTYKER
jgi:hypothetical protein